MFPRCLLAFALLGAFPACSTAVMRFDTKTMVGLRDVTEVHELEVECPGAVDDLEAGFSHDCKAGSLRLQVLSPSGELALSNSAGVGSGEGEFHARGGAGTWRCRIELKGFTGDYTATLEARGNWPGVTTMTRSVEVTESRGGR